MKFHTTFETNGNKMKAENPYRDYICSYSQNEASNKPLKLITIPLEVQHRGNTNWSRSSRNYDGLV